MLFTLLLLQVAAVAAWMVAGVTVARQSVQELLFPVLARRSPSIKAVL
jgi:hypothetical protein